MEEVISESITMKNGRGYGVKNGRGYGVTKVGLEQLGKLKIM